MANVSDAYDGKSIFITGATGFLGKVLVEKILYSCPNIEQLFILIRKHKGIQAKTRFDEYKSHIIFDRIRKCNPLALQKLYLIEGDCFSKELGISEADKTLLQSEVNIVFHIVATVKFNEKLQTAIDLNVNGTLRVLNLAKNMSKLESFIYVSTTYSTPWKQFVPESIEPFTLIDFDYKSNEDCKLTQTEIESLSCEIGLNKKYPNTYTVTKHMAEQVVYGFSKQFTGINVIVVRPSIITAAAYEPIIGWIDSFNGPCAMMVETARGTIKSIIGDGSKVADMIPVDLVASTIITCVWYESVKERPQNNFSVYNCTSGGANPITWEKFGTLVVKYSFQNPTNHILMCPGITFRPKNILHRIIVLLFHFLPAFIIDLLLKPFGYRNKMMGIAKIINTGIEGNAYFTSREWYFDTSNHNNLSNQLEMSPSRYDFNCSANCFDWDTYLRGHMLGIRQYLLKESNSTLTRAKWKLMSLYCIKSCTKLAFIYFLWSLSRNYIFDQTN